MWHLYNSYNENSANASSHENTCEGLMTYSATHHLEKGDISKNEMENIHGHAYMLRIVVGRMMSHNIMGCGLLSTVHAQADSRKSQGISHLVCASA